MQTDREFGRPVRRLESILSRQLGLSSGPLALRAVRSRRILPKEVRRDLMAVAQAQHLSGHPKIARQIDRREVRNAYRRAIGFLRGPGMDDIRRGRRLNAAGALAGNLLTVFALVFLVLWWRNFI